MTTNTPKPAPDWQQIELDYRAGIKTLRQIAQENGISHVAIDKRAKRQEWTRDLSVRIQARSEDLVNRSEVNKEVNKTENLLTERKVVNGASRIIADLRMEQRKAISRNCTLVNTLENELLVFEGGLPDKVRMAKMLTETRRIVIDMQRQAYGIDPKAGAHDAPENDSGVAQLRAMVQLVAQAQKGAVANGASAAAVVNAAQ